MIRKLTAAILCLILVSAAISLSAGEAPPDAAVSAAKEALKQVFPEDFTAWLPTDADWKMEREDETSDWEITLILFREGGTEITLSALYNENRNEAYEPSFVMTVPVSEDDEWGARLFGAYRNWTGAAEQNDEDPAEEPYKSVYSPEAIRTMMEPLAELGYHPEMFTCNADAIDTDGSLMIMDAYNGAVTVMADFMNATVREAMENGEDDIGDAEPHYVLSIHVTAGSGDGDNE